MGYAKDAVATVAKNKRNVGGGGHYVLRDKLI